MYLQFIFQTLYQRPFSTWLAVIKSSVKQGNEHLRTLWAGEWAGTALTESSLILSMNIQDTHPPAQHLRLLAHTGKRRPPFLPQSCYHSQSEEQPTRPECALLKPRCLQTTGGSEAERESNMQNNTWERMFPFLKSGEKSCYSVNCFRYTQRQHKLAPERCRGGGRPCFPWEQRSWWLGVHEKPRTADLFHMRIVHHVQWWVLFTNFFFN